MKTFIKESFANRLGIVLTALNVCYFVSKNFVGYIFSHNNGGACFFGKSYMYQWMRLQCADVMLYVNSPALVASTVLGELTQGISSGLCNFTQARIQIALSLVFITLQWLFIGQTAKTIARAVRPTHN
jgi:hypothetical protein